MHFRYRYMFEVDYVRFYVFTTLIVFFLFLTGIKVYMFGKQRVEFCVCFPLCKQKLKDR